MILMHRITRIFTVLLSEKDRFVPAMQKAASICCNNWVFTVSM